MKVTSSQTSEQFSKKEILEIIDNAKKFEKSKGIDKLRKLVEDYKKEFHPTSPKPFSEQIRATGETAYQRAVFLSGKAKLHSLGEVVWSDLELPVVLNKSRRRPCVDLIGMLDGKTPVLCELKFASKNSSSNSPVYAVIELLIYYYLIVDNCCELDNEKVFHKNERVKNFEWSKFNSSSIFIICANETYWKYWIKRYEKQKIDIKPWLGSFLKFRFFSTSDFDFKKQKETNSIDGKYIPSVLGKTEWSEIYL